MPGYANLDGSPPNTTTPPPPGTPGWRQWYLNQNPEAGWVEYLQGLGLYGFDPASNWARQQYGRTYGMYNAQAADNPNLGFWDWIQGAGLDLRGQFSQTAPSARGEYNQMQAPRARFMRAY